MTNRTIASITTAHRQLEGDGFEVRRPFPSTELDLLDPFLLLDHLGPKVEAPRQAVGTPEHPHRGFETVTYLLEGELAHRDSLGNGGLLGPGDTQWMTAGAGIIHQEGPSQRMLAEGGLNHGVQLWVNLPAALKMTAPAYQDVRSADVARSVSDDGVAVRVIAGNAFGLTGPGRTHTPITYAHVTVPAGAQRSTSTDDTHNWGIYVLGGHVVVNGSTVLEGQFARFGDGDIVELTGVDTTSDVLLLTGQPIGEQVARYGPFVMNTRAEIAEAIEDFQAGRFGTIAATTR